MGSAAAGSRLQAVAMAYRETLVTISA